MEIKYTYKEPDERPIEKAEFKSSRDNDKCEITIFNPPKQTAVSIKTAGQSTNVLLLTKEDFADFTALVNRINRQINGGTP